MKKSNTEYSEIIQLLIWAYTQGYQHAAQIVNDALPKHETLAKMFEEALKEKQD